MDDPILFGRHAQRILDDDVFRLAVDMADDAFVDQWRRADTPQERERAHALQAALQEVLTQLKIIAGNGEIAAAKNRQV